MPGQHLNDTERRLRDMWDSNYGPSLRSVEITNDAPLRGIRGITLDLRYPLVVLAGKNGTGKSTILACIACAYRNASAYVSHFLKKSYFNFTDLFVNTPVDADLANVKVRWTYRDASRSILMAEAKKGPSRWRGYDKRAERATDFLGLIRALHPSELRILRSYFGKNAAISPVSLGDYQKTAVSSIMTRNYDDVQCEIKGRYSLHFLQTDGARYSGFNAGAGEDISCLISRILQNLPDKSLLVVEELETGLHPAAQRRLMQHLLEVCWNRKIQIVCSSHSQTILESVPALARVLLVRCGASLQPRYGVSVAEAVSDMGEVAVTELCAYVEDDAAKRLVLECLPAEMRQRVRVIDCGNWDDVIRFVSAFRRDPALGNAIGILDGDRNGQDTDHRSALDKYVGGHASDEDWEWLRERLHFLPGSVPPEELFRQYGREQPYRNRVASELNADAATIDGFFASFVQSDSHGLPFQLGQRVGLEEDRVLVGLARAACAFDAAAFEGLKGFIHTRLAVGGW